MNLNHNIFNKRNYTILALIVAGIVLVLIAFRGCEVYQDNKAKRQDLNELQNKLKDAQESNSKREESLINRVTVLQSQNADLQEQLSVYKSQNKTYTNTIRQLSASQTKARQIKDTAQYISNCDSIEQVALNQQALIENYQVTIDASFKNYEAQLAAKDSLLAERANFNAMLKATSDKLTKQVGDEIEINEQLTKKYKREKTLSRGLAIAVLVTGSILILKK